MDSKITNITAEQIMDSRNNPTLKVSVQVGELTGSFLVPSGASTGKYEAFELRDAGGGKSSVYHAIEKIETIIKPALMGMDVCQQKQIDQTIIELDGTAQKTNLGGNSLIGVSIACAKVAAKVKNLEIYQYLRTLEEIKPSRQEPFLYFNLINGGKHARKKLAFQEYHIVPQVESAEESVEISKKIQETLDKLVAKEFTEVFDKGDEGGIALDSEDILEPLVLIKKAVEQSGFTDKIKFALDVAASSFYDHDKKTYAFMEHDWTTDEFIELYKRICLDYPIISIEDPLDEEDFAGFSKLQDSLTDVKIIGDDLTVTNNLRLKEAIEKKSIKGIIIKPNQIGTLTETLETMKLARDNDIDCIVSHRSGETMDDFIADLSWAFGCFGLKSGALGPKERNVKYERIINITKEKNAI